MSNFTLPNELTLESISNTFLQIFQALSHVTGRTEKLEASPKQSLEQVIMSYSSQPRGLAVDLYAVDGLIKSMNSKVLTAVQALEDSVNLLTTCNEKLLLTVNRATRTTKKKIEEIEKKISSFLEYTKNGFLSLFLLRKKKKIFASWAEEVKKKKRVASMLKISLKKIHKTRLKSGFEVWKKLVRYKKESSINYKLLQEEKEKIKGITFSIQSEFEMIKSNLNLLSIEKADLLEVNDLKTLATKTDLRVLYNEMREILVSYFTNLKTYNEEKFQNVQKSISDVQETVCTKADLLSFEELHSFSYKLKEELVQTNKNHQNLNEIFSNFTKSAQIQKTHFQLELIDKRMETLELKYAQDKSQELEFSELIKILETKKPAEDNQRQNRLTDFLERPSSLTRKRNSFHSVVTNKKTN